MEQNHQHQHHSHHRHLQQHHYQQKEATTYNEPHTHVERRDLHLPCAEARAMMSNKTNGEESSTTLSSSPSLTTSLSTKRSNNLQDLHSYVGRRALHRPWEEAPMMVETSETHLDTSLLPINHSNDYAQHPPNLAENSLNQNTLSYSYSSSQSSDLLLHDISQHHSLIPTNVHVQKNNLMQPVLRRSNMLVSENYLFYQTNQHRHEGYNRSETGNDAPQQANSVNQVLRSGFRFSHETSVTRVSQDEAEKQQERPLVGKKRKQPRSDANTESHLDFPSTSGNTNFRRSRMGKESKLQELGVRKASKQAARSVGNRNAEMRSGSDPVSDGSGGSEVSCPITALAEQSSKKYRRNESNKASAINNI